MRSIFLKVFCLFCLSNAVLLLVAFFSFTLLPDAELEHRLTTEPMDALAEQAATMYEQGGQPALQAYLAQLESSEHVRGFLLDRQGQPLSGPVPAHIASQIVRYPQRIPPPENRAGRFFISAAEVRLASGTPYRFIATYRAPHQRRHLLAPPYRRFGFFLATIALASALIAYLCTRPLRQLQAATRQFAEGNLAIRAPVAIQKRADAIGELGREFDHMAERIEKMIAAQSRLLRDVSHELRSPLARMQVAATLAEEHAGKAAEEELARIQTEIQRLNALIERLLTLTRLESGVSPLVMHDVDLVKLLSQIAADAEYEHSGEGKHVRLEAVAPVVVSGDEPTLCSAFENVIRNALRYTAADTEVTVTIEPTEPAPLMRRIRICDHGSGVPEEHLTRVFEPFFRSDDARNERTGSHGIGLAIARAVIALHGGQIHAHNHPEGGLCVTIDLPTLQNLTHS